MGYKAKGNGSRVSVREEMNIKASIVTRQVRKIPEQRQIFSFRKKSEKIRNHKQSTNHHNNQSNTQFISKAATDEFACGCDQTNSVDYREPDAHRGGNQLARDL